MTRDIVPWIGAISVAVVMWFVLDTLYGGISSQFQGGIVHQGEITAATGNLVRLAQVVGWAVPVAGALGTLLIVKSFIDRVVRGDL